MKRSTLIILIIASVLICGTGYLVVGAFNQPRQNLPDTGQREAELGGPKTVNLTDVAVLSDILLPSQMQAVRSQVSTFLLEYLDPNTTAVSVVGTPAVNKDGSVTFTAEAKAPVGKQYSFERNNPNSDYATGQTVTGTSKSTTRFTVVLNRDSYTSLTMTVKEYNYTAVEPLSSE